MWVCNFGQKKGETKTVEKQISPVQTYTMVHKQQFWMPNWWFWNNSNHLITKNYAFIKVRERSEAIFWKRARVLGVWSPRENPGKGKGSRLGKQWFVSYVMPPKGLFSGHFWALLNYIFTQLEFMLNFYTIHFMPYT